jgi:hypothetical protein
MRIVFLILIFLHGLIHLLGFVKAFGFKEVKELSLPISKPMGFLWLTAAILLITYGILQMANSKYAWVFGFVAALMSQVLIILFWKDARFGTIANFIILVVSVFSWGNYNFKSLVEKETLDLIQNKVAEKRILEGKDINDLPEPVQNWLRNSGAVGKDMISIGKISQKAEMKMKPGQETWISATAIQYTNIDSPAFIWTVDAKMNRLLNFKGRDKFENGRGEMLIKLNSLINVVNAQGEKLNEGSLQRYLGEMVWFPSLALSPYITWEAIDSMTAKASMIYKGTSGSGTFYFNTEGDFIRFSALRFMGNEPGARRYEWILLVDEYRSFEGIKVPSKMTATWKLDNENWTWLKLEIVDVKYNANAFL